MCKNKPKVVPLNRYLTGCFEFNFKVATFVVQTYVKKKHYIACLFVLTEFGTQGVLN